MTTLQNWLSPHVRRPRRVKVQFSNFNFPLSISSVGFTLIEALIVMGVLGLLATLVVPVSYRFQSRSAVHGEALALVSDVRRVQASAAAGVGDTAHGVHFEATPIDRWVVFQGTSYTDGLPANAVHTIPEGVDMTSVALTGGGAELFFTERRSTTTQNGTIILRGANGETRTVTVNTQGVVEIQ